MEKLTKEQIAEQSRNYEMLALSLQTEIGELTALSAAIFLARVAMVGVQAEMAAHAAKHGKNQKWQERDKLNRDVISALDEAARLDDQVYTSRCLINQIMGERNLYFRKWKEAEKQLEATRKAWEQL